MGNNTFNGTPEFQASVDFSAFTKGIPALEIMKIKPSNMSLGQKQHIRGQVFIVSWSMEGEQLRIISLVLSCHAPCTLLKDKIIHMGFG